MKSLAGRVGLVGAAAGAPRRQRPLPQSEVAVVGLNPGFLCTDGVLQHMTSDALEKRFRADRSGRLIPVFNPQAPRQVFPC
jgi:hypothetical protein